MDKMKKDRIRTSTKQLWWMMINTTIDVHLVCLALLYSVKQNNIGIWVSATAIIGALWGFCSLIYINNNNRKVKENTMNNKNSEN
jgi:preprotein translocase subunit SecF